MLKKHPILSMLSLLFIFVVSSVVLFPEKFFPSLTPTYVETIQSNWNVTLPTANKLVYLLDNRTGSHGDGEAITELYYANSSDLNTIKAISNDWVYGEQFDINVLPDSVQNLLGDVDDQALYLVLKEDMDYLIIKLEDDKATLVESYI